MTPWWPCWSPPGTLGLSLQHRAELGALWLLVHSCLAAHTIGLLAWGEGWGPSGCSAVIKEWVLDFSRELSTPGLALLPQADRCCKSSPGGHRAGAGCLRGFFFQSNVLAVTGSLGPSPSRNALYTPRFCAWKKQRMSRCLLKQKRRTLCSFEIYVA